MNMMISMMIVLILLITICSSIGIFNNRNSIIRSSKSSSRSRSSRLYNNPLNQFHDINKLGDRSPYLVRLDSILVLRCFDYIRTKLLVSDRICTLEWFNQIIQPFFIERQGEEEMLKLISSLIKLNPEKITVTKKSDSNPDITVDIVQIIEPRMVASILLACRINVIDDMISQLPLILKENAEAAKYAATCLQDGDSTARRNRKPVLPVNSTTDSILTFSSLNMLITNAALSEMRADLYAEQKKQYVEYLDEFVENVAQSGTLDDLLRRGSKNVRRIAVNFRKWQEGSSEIEEAEESSSSSVESKENDILTDVHKPGSPRHLIERLMLQGLASSSVNVDRKNGKNRLKRKINNDEDRKEDEDEDIDVQSLAQSIIDSRAMVAESFNDILINKKRSFKEQEKTFSELIETNGGYAKVQVNGVVSPGLEVSTFSYKSPALQINTTFEGNFNKTANETGTDFRTTAGKPPTLPNDVNGGNVEQYGKPGWKAEDGSQTKADTSGTRQKSLISVLDPPRQRPPAPPRRNGNNIEIIERPNNVDYMDEDFGSINDFIELGPNTRIRIVGITEEENKRFACLEAMGGILPIGFIFRRWVDYNDAVNFLDLNNDITTSSNNKLDSSTIVESDKQSVLDNDIRQDDNDLFDDDNNSPFFGGGIIRM